MKNYNFLLLFAAALLLGSCGESMVVESGSTWTVESTTELASFTIEEGASLETADGNVLSMTTDGVETPIAPGTYSNVVINKSEENVVTFSDMGANLAHQFRQALFIDESGIVPEKSVTSAAGDYAFSDGILTGGQIQSVGESFNGLYVAGGTVTSTGLNVRMTGNGGNDFAGWGAGIMSTGENTTLVVDGADVLNEGAIRTTVIASGGSNLIVKNSTIKAYNGTLPDDYVSNVTPGQMKDAPWMLGIIGNNRATNLLGNSTTATYINSSIATEGWGVLSIDAGQNTKLTAINSDIEVTGESGYGTYSIGRARNAFYGSNFNVRDYAAIITDGTVIMGASSMGKINALNEELNLGLSSEEISALENRETIVNSDRFGFMWHGAGNVMITDATEINTGKTVFLVKGARTNISVDGTDGATLNPGNGVILQLMDNDDPGPVFTPEGMFNTGVYKESEGTPEKMDDFDPTMVHDDDTKATFSNISLTGDFYNSVTSTPKNDGNAPPPPPMPGPGGTGGPDSDAPIGGMSFGPKAKNLVLTFENSTVTGVISASTSRHTKSEIGGEDYKLLGEVTNTPGPAINNGVIITLNGSTWNVTGTSYLTSLTISEGSSVEGTDVSMTVNGRATALGPGTYSGNIVITAE